MKFRRILLLGIGIPAIAIQFFRPERITSDTPAGQEFEAAYSVPAEVAEYLKVGCYDCHSNAPRYPWYTNLQPVGWWLADHIEHGRGHLNFDEFVDMPARIRFHKLEEMEEMVEDGEMPLPSYLYTHGDAKLDDGKKQMLLAWVDEMKTRMEGQYPPDSLRMRRKSKPESETTGDSSGDHDHEDHDHEDDSH